MKVPRGYRKSCSHIWHSAKRLEQRKVPARLPSNSREGTSASGSLNCSANQGRSRETDVGEQHDESVDNGAAAVADSDAPIEGSSRRRRRCSMGSAGSSQRVSTGGTRRACRL